MQRGWRQSRMDPCLFPTIGRCERKKGKDLEGIMGIHVDDAISEGEGSRCNEALKSLRERFPYRKWRTGSGDSCGSQVSQTTVGKIYLNTSRCALELRPIKVRKVAGHEKANKEEIRALRRLIGSALWLARETRPDLSVMVTQAQMSLPEPLVSDLWAANHIVKRPCSTTRSAVSIIRSPRTSSRRWSTATAC